MRPRGTRVVWVWYLVWQEDLSPGEQHANSDLSFPGELTNNSQPATESVLTS